MIWSEALQTQVDLTDRTVRRLLELGGDACLQEWVRPLNRNANIFGDVREALSVLDAFCTNITDHRVYDSQEARLMAALECYRKDIQKKVDEREIRKILEVHERFENDVERIARATGISMSRVDALWERCFPVKRPAQVISQGGLGRLTSD